MSPARHCCLCLHPARRVRVHSDPLRSTLPRADSPRSPLQLSLSSNELSFLQSTAFAAAAGRQLSLSLYGVDVSATNSTRLLLPPLGLVSKLNCLTPLSGQCATWLPRSTLRPVCNQAATLHSQTSVQPGCHAPLSDQCATRLPTPLSDQRATRLPTPLSDQCAA